MACGELIDAFAGKSQSCVRRKCVGARLTRDSQHTWRIYYRNPSRNCPGVIPVQRLNARLKLLVSANPNR